MTWQRTADLKPRPLVLQEREGRFRYRSSWRQTYVVAAGLSSAQQHRKRPLQVSTLYSDLLYQPFHCATTPLRAEWLQRSTIDRCSSLSAQDFRRLYEQPNRPVVLTDAVRSPAEHWTYQLRCSRADICRMHVLLCMHACMRACRVFTQLLFHEAPAEFEASSGLACMGACSQAQGWPARKKWTRGYLRKAFKGQTIMAGDYPMAFDDYLAYMDGCADEMPLYLFDCTFASKAPQLAADYSVSGSVAALMSHAAVLCADCIQKVAGTANIRDLGRTAGTRGLCRGPLGRPGGAGSPRLQVVLRCMHACIVHEQPRREAEIPVLLHVRAPPCVNTWRVRGHSLGASQVADHGAGALGQQLPQGPQRDLGLECSCARGQEVGPVPAARQPARSGGPLVAPLSSATINTVLKRS